MNGYLVDTHSLLWAILEPEKLGKQAISILENDVLLVTRKNSENNVVIMPQSLFDSWKETIYLLKSPANATPRC